MEKVIRSYELVYIIDAALTEEAIAETVKKFADLIAANGTVEKTEEWGKRKLAYEINKKTEGYYVFVCFKSEPEFPAELDRIFGITDGILRSMIINPEE
jgi:small subunit ribosomal protein S6